VHFGGRDLIYNGWWHGLNLLHNQAQNSNRLLTLLECSMLILDTVTYLFCAWLCNKLSPYHQPL